MKRSECEFLRDRLLSGHPNWGLIKRFAPLLHWTQGKPKIHAGLRGFRVAPLLHLPYLGGTTSRRSGGSSTIRLNTKKPP